MCCSSAALIGGLVERADAGRVSASISADGSRGHIRRRLEIQFANDFDGLFLSVESLAMGRCGEVG